MKLGRWGGWGQRVEALDGVLRSLDITLGAMEGNYKHHAVKRHVWNVWKGCSSCRTMGKLGTLGRTGRAGQYFR